MAAEAPNYIEKAKLGQISKEENEVLETGKFDEDKLRKDFTERLDKARGNKELQRADELQHYAEAKQQIEANLKNLKNVYEYAKEKTDVLVKMAELKTINPAADMEDLIRAQLFFDDVLIFKNKPKTSLGAKMDFHGFQVDLDKFIAEYSPKMQAAFEGLKPKILGKETLKQFQTKAENGTLELADFRRLHFAKFQLKYQMDYKFLGAKDPQKYLAEGEVAMNAINSALQLNLNKLSEQDRTAWMTYTNAEAGVIMARTSFESDKADLEFGKAVDKLNMQLAYNSAEMDKRSAIGYGFKEDHDLLKPGNDLMAAGLKKIAQHDYKGAAELFVKAKEKYQLPLVMSKSANATFDEKLAQAYDRKQAERVATATVKGKEKEKKAA